MSLSRSPITVTMVGLASSGLAATAVDIQRCDSLSDSSRKSCETVRRPSRVHTSPLKSPRQVPVSASTASIGCSNTPWLLPLPISPSPRRRRGVVLKWISLVSWIASTWRPATAATVFSLQLSMMRSGVTLALPRKRLNCTSSARSPLESRRRQTSLPATMRSTSAAPLYRDDDPRTGPMSIQSVTTLQHLRSNRSAAIEITRIPDSGIPQSCPESICRTTCVHALVRTQGPIRRVLSAQALNGEAFRNHQLLWLWVPAFAGTTVIGAREPCSSLSSRRPCERRDPYAAAHP